MSTKVRGYNIVLKLATKLIAGTVENTLKITPTIEESLIKEDSGNPQLEVIGYESEITIGGLMMIKEVGEAGTHVDYTDLRDSIIAKAPIAFVYGGTQTGDAIISGSLVITDYSESTNAKDVGGMTITCRVVPGTLVQGTL